jgi:hypothetical protein
VYSFIDQHRDHRWGIMMEAPPFRADPAFGQRPMTDQSGNFNRAAAEAKGRASAELNLILLNARSEMTKRGRAGDTINIGAAGIVQTGDAATATFTGNVEGSLQQALLTSLDGLHQAVAALPEANPSRAPLAEQVQAARAELAKPQSDRARLAGLLRGLNTAAALVTDGDRLLEAIRQAASRLGVGF